MSNIEYPANFMFLKHRVKKKLSVSLVNHFSKGSPRSKNITLSKSSATKSCTYFMGYTAVCLEVFTLWVGSLTKLWYQKITYSTQSKTRNYIDILHKPLIAHTVANSLNSSTLNFNDDILYHPKGIAGLHFDLLSWARFVSMVTQSISQWENTLQMYEIMETLRSVNTAPTTAVLICSPFIITGTITFAPFILIEVTTNVLNVLTATDFFLVSNYVHHGDKPKILTYKCKGSHWQGKNEVIYRYVKPVTAVPWISILSRTLLDTWLLIQSTCSLGSYSPSACCFWSFIYEGLLLSKVVDYIFITLSMSSFFHVDFINIVFLQW